MIRIGIDFGGHTISAARIEWSCADRPAATQKTSLATPEGRSVDACVAALADAAVSLAAGDRPDFVGVAMPAMLDTARRRAMKLPNFPASWDGLDLAGALESALYSRGVRCPVRIENDANCYALGEGSAGAAMGLDDYVIFTMGTGIGCGIVLGGRLLRGSHGMAGEGGHVVVGGDAPCGCGGIGHAETFAAADGTERRAREAGLPTDLRALWPMRGTPEADAVLAPSIDAMARATASVMHLIDPQAVVIGGGMSAAEGLVDEIASATVKYLSAPFRATLDIRRSALGNDAAVYGAAMLTDEAR